jgi:hypothetical protein
MTLDLKPIRDALEYIACNAYNPHAVGRKAEEILTTLEAQAEQWTETEDLLKLGWELSTWAGSINWRGGENQKEWLDDLRVLIQHYQHGYRALKACVTPPPPEVSDEEIVEAMAVAIARRLDPKNELGSMSGGVKAIAMRFYEAAAYAKAALRERYDIVPRRGV